AIFGHGNVAALGEALYAARDVLPTLRAHNEQAMGHAAVAFAKASNRRRMMACTTSIGPGATNLATAAAVAHVNRLPVLLLPGDVFATRAPDPVLQQVEDFGDGLITANDCLRPLSRYFDRITRPEQLVVAFNRAMQTLTDPATCGPVTLALCQDVQAEAYAWPQSLFEERVWTPRRPPPAREELARAAQALRSARRPLIVCGGGVLYSEAGGTLREFCERHGIPSGETQAGKSALPGSDPLNLGGIGVTGTAAANSLGADADVVLAVGTRLQDFTTGSATLFDTKGGLPGELHRHWQAEQRLGYHLEYGFSCMGYEIAGGLGVKLAQPEREVIVMVGDGSYLMLNSEIATSVAMGLKLIVVLLDNGGF